MWFTETAWPPILILSAAAALLVAAWYSTRRGAYLVAALGLAVGCVALWAVERAVVTERERVEAAVRGIAAAYQREDLDATLSYISPSPQAAWIRALAAGTIKTWSVEPDLRISGVQIWMKAGDTLAEADFRANGTVVSQQDHYRSLHPSRWLATWRLEEGRWRMIDLQPLDVLSGEPVDLLGFFARRRN